jgi:hypothetical protein
MFSVPLLRSHATVSLVDRDRLQFYHANRSVILVSSAINFAKEEFEGKDKFIASVLAFHRLSFEQNGIIGSQLPGLDNAGLVKRNEFGDDAMVQDGNVLHFPETSELKELDVTLEDVISREPAIVGRSTAVLNARAGGGGDLKPTMLVVKVSWPTTGRVSETEFIRAARDAAAGKYEWARYHLPRVCRSRSVAPSPGSTLDLVAKLFDDAKFADGQSFVYERRVLRIIVQERLTPLRYLRSVRAIGQVFLDIACGTYDRFWFLSVFR